MTDVKYKFEDKVALVTGGGSGIGRATAIAFSSHGAKVVVSDINTSGGEETVQCIRGMGGQAVFVRANVTSEDDMKKAVEIAVTNWGKLDYANNNAGIEGLPAPLVDFPRKTWASACKQAGTPGMVSQGLRRTAVRNMVRHEYPSHDMKFGKDDAHVGYCYRLSIST